MIPNHQQLLGLLERMEPIFLAGDFATDFKVNPEADGERGTFLYFEGGYWDIRMDGGPRFLLTPWGSQVIQCGGSVEDGPAMSNLPRRPPWSLVLPHRSTFLGRAHDDWQLDAGKSIACDGSSWIAALTSLESTQFKGTLSVDAATYAITRVELGHMVQTLTIARTEPTVDDFVALEAIKSTVKEFSGPL
jgi:hypothetical protein